ncbi:MAG: T9SS type A sorting domain-containing protein, partial [Ignavibacteriales bacterium]|nr:T9SS type A sorting domain-containing protein [Ignavibacteriales bacterium]
WSTATETNNYGFEIERRPVAHGGGWVTIGFVQGAGTSSQPREYSFVDVNVPAGRYAYRLRQIDFDGSYLYHSASEVEIGLAEKQLALNSNYPNPFNPSTSIEFTVPRDGKATLKVYNMIGQEVASLFDGLAEAGRVVRVTFSAPTLPSGLYFYRLEFENTTVVRRMMLLK